MANEFSLRYRLVILTALLSSILIVLLIGMLQRKIESLARSDNANVLLTVVDITDPAIKSWVKEEKAQAMIWAKNPDLRDHVLEILKVPKQPYDLINAYEQKGLRDALAARPMGPVA